MTTPSSPAIDLGPRSVGELLDLTFHLYRRNFLRLLGIALIVLGPVLALNLLSSASSLANYISLFSDTLGAQPGPASVVASALAACAGGLALLAGIFTPWMEGALVFNVIEQVLGRQPDWRASYRETRPRWGALWVASAIRTVALMACLIPLVAGLYGGLIAGAVGFSALSVNSPNAPYSALLMAGLAAICLPIGLVGGGLAVFITATWCMTEPVIVGEGAAGFASLGRSSMLVTDHRWRMIGRLLIFEVMRFFIITLPVLAVQLFIVGGAASAASRGDTSPLGIAGLVGASIFSSAADVLVVPLYAVYITANYLDLRVRKENLDLQLRVAQLPAVPLTDAPVAAISPAQALAQPPVAGGNASPDSPMPAVDASMTPAQRISLLYPRLRSDADNPALHNELGMAYQQVGDLYSALDSFNRARALAPRNAEYAYNLALLQRARKDMASARRALADCLQLQTDAAERQKVLDDPALQDLVT